MDPVQSQYGGSAQSIQPHNHGGGELPFTGLDVLPLVIVAAVLAGVGFVLALFRGVRS